LTLGGSFDFLKGSRDVIPNGQEDQFNPKVGLTWNVFPGTTIRAAVSRVLRKTLISEQTLEPTQVAGFNQFYDDFNSTSAWRYGGAVDQKFTDKFFGGAEFSARFLDTPTIDLTDPANPINRTLSAKELLGRAYLFWTPHPWVALRTEYQYEQFRKDEPITEEAKKLNTHRVPFGINFFHPSGLSASLRPTFWHHGGRVLRLATFAPESVSTNFWTVDAALTYRLPQRYGFVTFGATNLLDRKFKFFNTDINNPVMQPNRMIFGKITVALP
jgi:outer membrane receptor protein involved in Fe transport